MNAHEPTPESPADAFTAFYRTHVVAVRAQVRVWVAAADVDEIVSATFMTAWTRFDDVPPDAPKAWLLGVARNHCRNRGRRERRATALTDAIRDAQPRHAMTDAAGPDDDVEAALLDALAALSGDDQELLTLSIWQELGPR